VKQSQRATAYHEAGHIVAAYAQRLAVKGVSIVEDEETRGRADTGKWPVEDLLLTADRRRRWLEKRIIVFLAGAQAEELLAGERDPAGASDDYHQAVQLASYLTGSTEETEAYLAWLGIRARNLVRVPVWAAAIEAVAGELLTAQTLSGRRVRAIIRATLAAGGR
jgi:hypothetical protein